MAYTIVSFCGGGMRGLISLRALEMLAAHNPGILTNTHLMAGTSVGSTIISGLVAPHGSPQQLIEDFLGPARIFFSRISHDRRAPAFGNSAMLQKLRALHGDQTLSSLTQQVLFTAFDLGAGPQEGKPATPWGAQLFTNVKSPLVSTAETTIVDAVMACEAMPAMFPSYKGYVDGAFVHHDPTLAAIALAVSSGVDLREIVVICLGTGFMENWIGSDTTQWGVEQWLQGDGTDRHRLPPLLTNQALTPENAVCPILNLCLNGTSTRLIPWLSQMLLPGRYVNLNPILREYIPEIASEPAQLNTLLESADGLRSTEAWRQATHLLDTYW